MCKTELARHRSRIRLANLSLGSKGERMPPGSAAEVWLLRQILVRGKDAVMVAK